jgi:hypothetical protein
VTLACLVPLVNLVTLEAHFLHGPGARTPQPAGPALSASAVLGNSISDGREALVDANLAKCVHWGARIVAVFGS